jgi:Ni/Co efflux regulator RcnB
MDRHDALAAVVSAALTRYTTQLAECRAVLGDAVGRSRSPHERPPDLRHAGHLLAKDRRRLAERAVDDVWKGLGADLEQLVTALAAAVADEPPTQVERRHYPLATEQVFAALLVGVGPQRIQTRVMELLTACGNDAPTIRYAIRYVEWVHRDTQSTITSIVLPAAVSAFEEFFAALLRLWLTLYPRALGADKKQFDAGTVASYAHQRTTSCAWRSTSAWTRYSLSVPRTGREWCRTDSS